MDNQSKRTELWLELRDEAYEQKLYRFLAYHYGDRFELHHYREFAEGVRPSRESLLLTDVEEDYGKTTSSNGAPNLSFGRTVLLTAGESIGGINLYQSGHEIAKALLERDAAEKAFVRAENAREAEKEEAISGGFLPQEPVEKRGQWIVVYSPVGGGGTSTLAMQLAAALKESINGRVLYLCLEEMPAWELYFKSETGFSLSDLLYYLGAEPKGSENTAGASAVCFGEEAFLSEQWWNKLITEQPGGLSFIRPAAGGDLRLMTETELKKLTELLRKRFRYIVADMGGGASKENRLLWQYCDKLLLLTLPTESAKLKLRSFLRELERGPEEYAELMHKTRLVYRGKPDDKEEASNPAARILPLEKQLFKKQDRLMVPNKDSAYYKRVAALAKELREELSAGGGR